MSVSTAEEKKEYPVGFKAKKNKKTNCKNGRFSSISKNPLILKLEYKFRYWEA
jgi:hypothetical protein